MPWGARHGSLTYGVAFALRALPAKPGFQDKCRTPCGDAFNLVLRHICGPTHGMGLSCIDPGPLLRSLSLKILGSKTNAECCPRPAFHLMLTNKYCAASVPHGLTRDLGSAIASFKNLEFQDGCRILPAAMLSFNVLARSMCSVLASLNCLGYKINAELLL